jgi:5-methylcytosine-specific restriction enzyme subunit McrC
MNLDEELRSSEPRSPVREIVSVREYDSLSLPVESLVQRGRLDVYEWIAGSKFLSANLSGNSLVLRASGLIGIIPLNDRVALNVSPRFSISNLTRVIRIAQHSPLAIEQFIRDYSSDTEELPSLIDTYANAFIAAVKEVVHRQRIATTI